MKNNGLRKLLAIFIVAAFLCQAVFVFAVQSGTGEWVEDSEIGSETAVTADTGDEMKAYPGVEGYGAYSTGGRYGDVYHVTSLAPSGEGSLTYGLEELSGARTIVFDVGGVIDLTELGRELELTGEDGSCVTIAGQSAPYPGITVKGYGLVLTSVHDVIIRDIRVRCGGVRADGENYTAYPLTIDAGKDVIVDHCSFEWGTIYAFTVTGENITMTNNIFAKSLSANSPSSTGGASYSGMINAGTSDITFAKNYISGASQRTPRLADTNYADIYNVLLYDCGNGIDVYNTNSQNKNVLVNIHDNYARKGPNYSNLAPYRAMRSYTYSGGVMLYFDNNYKSTSSTSTSLVSTVTTSSSYGFNNILTFGGTNSSSGIDLSNITLDEWNNDERSHGYGSVTAASLTYMTYPFSAPRGEVLTLSNSYSNAVTEYAQSDGGMGATRPARDLYDTMLIEEMLGGTTSSVTMTEDEVTPFFEELEARTGRDLSAYKTSRTWNVNLGAGPVLYGANTTSTKPVLWDNYTDVNTNSSSYETNKYASGYTTDFEIGDWWGEYTGALGQEEVNGTTAYIAVKRTVTDLVPDEWMLDEYPELAEFLDKYREANYPGMSETNSSYEIVWDTAGDGIPDWYKEYRGLDASSYLADTVNPETGYTYLEEYLSLMAGDKPLESESEAASASDFKTNNISYASAQVFFNTDYRAQCTVEYGTEPGVYTSVVPLTYGEDTDYFNTYHAQMLTGLTPSTVYYYKVTALDEYGHESSAEYDADDSEYSSMTFTTAAAPDGYTGMPSTPVISSADTTSSSVTVTWSGDYDTDGGYALYYDTADYGTAYESAAYKIEGIDALTREYTVSGLENDTAYYFTVVAVNDNGASASEIYAVSTSSKILSYDFTTMTSEEAEEFLADNLTYELGGVVSIEPDPDTGENTLQIVDDSISHYTYLSLPLPEDRYDTTTVEVKLKQLYQKQTDALNGQDNVIIEGSAVVNTFKLNIYKNTVPNASSNSRVTAEAGYLGFESTSEPYIVSGDRYDGTVETGELKYNDTSIGSFYSGITPCDGIGFERACPATLQFLPVYYSYSTVYGDAMYSNSSNTDRTQLAYWYYGLGSAEFITYKLVISPSDNTVDIYENNNLVAEGLTYCEDTTAENNIAEIRLRTGNGYSWTSVASIDVYEGEVDGESGATPNPNRPTLAPMATATPIGAPTSTPTATPAPTSTPTPNPTLEPSHTLRYVFSEGVFGDYTTLPADTAVGGITVSKDSVIDDSTKTFAVTDDYPNNSGYSYTKRLKLGTATLSLDVPGDSYILIDAASANAGTNRAYSLYSGEELLTTFTCIGGETNSMFYEYTGEAATITIVPSAGINVYGIYVGSSLIDNTDPTASPAPTPTPTVTPEPSATPTAEPTETPYIPTEIYDIYFADDAHINASVMYNPDEGDGTGTTLLIASYSEDMMTECSLVRVTESCDLVIDFMKNEGEEVKAFLWSNSDSIIPVCIPISVGDESLLPTAEPTSTPEPTAEPTSTPTATPAPTATAPPESEYYVFSEGEFADLSSIEANVETGGITVSKASTIESSITKSFEPTEMFPLNSGYSYTSVLKIGTASLKLNLKGSCNVKIDAASANSSSDRSYSVFVGGNVLTSFMCYGGQANTLDLEYRGDSAVLTIIPDAGINVYGIYVDYVKYPE